MLNGLIQIIIIITKAASILCSDCVRARSTHTPPHSPTYSHCQQYSHTFISLSRSQCAMRVCSQWSASCSNSRTSPSPSCLTRNCVTWRVKMASSLAVELVVFVWGKNTRKIPEIQLNTTNNYGAFRQRLNNRLNRNISCVCFEVSKCI